MFFDTIPPPSTLRFDDGDRQLILRRSSVEDASGIAAAIAMSLPELWAHMPWAHFPEGCTAESQQGRLRALDEAWAQNREFSFTIFLPCEGGLELVGCLGLHPRSNHNRGFEIGYWIRSDMAGRGLCTLAVKMVTLAAFEVMKLDRLQVGCDKVNMASQRVIEKVGFPYEGLLRNMVYGRAPERVLAKGWRSSGDMRSYGLIPEDLAALPWAEPLRRHLFFEGGKCAEERNADE